MSVWVPLILCAPVSLKRLCLFRCLFVHLLFRHRSPYQPSFRCFSRVTWLCWSYELFSDSLQICTTVISTPYMSPPTILLVLLPLPFYLVVLVFRTVLDSFQICTTVIRTTHPLYGPPPTSGPSGFRDTKVVHSMCGFVNSYSGPYTDQDLNPCLAFEVAGSCLPPGRVVRKPERTTIGPLFPPKKGERRGVMVIQPQYIAPRRFPPPLQNFYFRNMHHSP